MQKLDTDGDGALNKDEISISSEVFDAADTNKDGVLSIDELEAASSAIGKELHAQDATSKHHRFFDFLRSQSDDTTETVLDQIA